MEEENNLYETFTEEELEVADILLNFERLMTIPDVLKTSNYWPSRKRSVLLAPPIPSLHAWRYFRHVREPVEVNNNGGDVAPVEENNGGDVAPVEENNGGDVAPVEVNNGGDVTPEISPKTPLSFPNSGRGLNPEGSSKDSDTKNKRSNEDYLAMVENLIKSRDVLRREVHKVKKHLSDLKAYNLDLKEFKQKFLNTRRAQQAQPLPITMAPLHHQPTNPYVGAQVAQPFPITMAPLHYQTTSPYVGVQVAQPFPITMAHLHQQPTVAYPNNSTGPIAPNFPPSNDRPEPVNHAGPSGIDLDVSAEHSIRMTQPYDMLDSEANGRARSSEARRVRREKVKSMRSGLGRTRD